MSQKKCCVPGCWESGKSHRTLHPFPNPKADNNRFNLWVYAIGGDIISFDNDYIFKQRRVCRAHFEEKYLCRNNRISNIALPTLNMPAYTKASKFSEAARKPLYERIERSYCERKENLSKNCGENVTNEVNLSRLQKDLQMFDDDVLEDVNDAGDIHSDVTDDGDKENEENQNQFSWQKSTQICIDDDDDFGEYSTVDIQVEQAEKNPKDTSSEDHKEYFCDSCTNSIVGFRYRCVECDNYDLCARCEAQARHDAHYMLRIPRPRPYGEIQSILHAIREKIKELTDNSSELDEIKLEPDFIALDPLSTPRVQTPQHTATGHDTDTHTDLRAMYYRKTYKPVYTIRGDSTQKPEVTQLKDTQEPQTVPDGMDLPKKQNLIKENENMHTYGNTSKRKLTTFIEESFMRDKRFKDTDETLEHHIENVHGDSNTSGKGLKRKDFEDMEETWLDEDILDEEIIFSSEEFKEDCEESSSMWVTRSATKTENAPVT